MATLEGLLATLEGLLATLEGLLALGLVFLSMYMFLSLFFMSKCALLLL